MTLWDAPASRWWPTVPVLYAAGGLSLTALLAAMTRLNPWSLLALLFVPYGLRSVTAARARVRLTPVGVEVRGLRTTVYPYAEIASVEVAPEWEGGRSVWLRLRGSQPQCSPEVLTPPPEWFHGPQGLTPPPEWWHEPGRSLTDVVAVIQARVDAS